MSANRLLLISLCSLAFFAPVVGCTANRPPAESLSASSQLITQLENGEKQTLVLYGTSLTARGTWSRQLQETLEAKYPNLITVHNAASSGKNSRWGRDFLAEGVLTHNPDTVIIEFSINDSTTRFDLSLEESRANLLNMIDQLRNARTDIEIILQVMNPAVGKPLGDSSHRRDQEAYADVYRIVARERNLRLIDHRPAWNAILREGGERAFRKLVRDGVHPSEEANAKIVFPKIARAIGLQLDNP